MGKNLNYTSIKKFYEECEETWPIHNNWYNCTKNKIGYIVRKYIHDGYVLNAGSGGNTYGLSNRMCHVDIVKKNISKYDDYIVASIEKLPLENLTFDYVICVGDVINYCKAEKAIKELYRVVKKGGKIIIEFENSNAYEYVNKDFYGDDTVIVNLEYMGKITNQYLYSYKYMEKILTENGFKIKKAYSFHILSGLISNWIADDNISCLFSVFDKMLNILSFFKKYGSNVLYLCERIV